MIKIIKHGSYKVATCSCGCEFEFDNADIVEEHVTCPECFAKVKVQPQPSRPLNTQATVPSVDNLTKGAK